MKVMYCSSFAFFRGACLWAFVRGPVGERGRLCSCRRDVHGHVCANVIVRFGPCQIQEARKCTNR